MLTTLLLYFFIVAIGLKCHYCEQCTDIEDLGTEKECKSGANADDACFLRVGKAIVSMQCDRSSNQAKENSIQNFGG